MTAETVTNYSAAQTIGAKILVQSREALRDGMCISDIQEVIASVAREFEAPLASPPVIGLGLNAAGRPGLFRHNQKLNGATLVTMDVRPQHSGVVGDFARTLIYGDNGRLWFYQRITEKVFANLCEGLGDCKNERNAYDLACELARREGCILRNPTGCLGHPLEPGSSKPAILAGMNRGFSHIARRLRGRAPLGLAARHLKGIWSIEPLIEVDRRQFLFNEAVAFSADGPQRLGEPLSELRLQSSV